MEIVDLLNNLSMEEKRLLSYHIATKISFADDECIETRNLDDDETDAVFNVVDGMYSFIDKVLSGRCSIQQSIDFDICIWENRIESDIIYFTDLMEKYSIQINWDTLYLEIEEWRKGNETTEKIQG